MPRLLYKDSGKVTRNLATVTYTSVSIGLEMSLSPVLPSTVGLCNQ